MDQLGSAWTEKDREVVGLQHLLFLNKRAAAVAEHAEPKKKKAKREDKLERLSAFDMIASWHNGLMAHMGAGLEVFLDRGEDEARVPPSLVLSLDWDQKQWCGVWFLRNKLGLCLEAVPDVTHRRSRDLDLAIDESRLKLVVTKGARCEQYVHWPMVWWGCVSGRVGDGLGSGEEYGRKRSAPLLLLETHRGRSANVGR